MKKHLTLFSLLITNFCWAQKIDLSLHLQKDSTYSFTTTASLKIDQFVNAAHQIVTTTIKGTMAHKVIAIKDTIYELEMRYKKMSMLLDMEATRREIASDDGKQDILSLMFANMVDRPIRMKINNRGRILEIGSMDSLYNGLLSLFPDLTQEQRQQATAQLRQSFGEKSIKSNFQDAFIILPIAAIGLNDSWVSNTVLETAGIQAKIVTNYTLKSSTNSAYLLEGVGTILSNGESDYKRSGDLDLKLTNVSGKVMAKMVLDKKTLWLKESTVEKNIKGTIQIKPSSRFPNGYSYPMSLTAQINTTGN